MSDFHGLGTALVTPFRDQEIDLEALTILVERQISASVDYLVALGTTGETSTLTPEEVKLVVNHIVKVNAGRLPVVLGIFGGNNTQAIVDKISQWPMQGIDALLSVTPYYSRPGQAGLVSHYRTLDKITSRPIIMYNVPSRTGVNLTSASVVEIATSCPNIIGIKEASGDLWQGAQMIRDCPDDFVISSGDDQTGLPLLSLGSDGIISVISNAYPEQFGSMVRLALQGQFDKARELHYLLLDIHPYLYAQSNPAGIKACLSLMGLCRADVRLPLVSLDHELRKGLKDAMQLIP